MAIVYRTTGAWGAGIGRPLHGAEADGNFYTLDQRMTGLEDNPPLPNNIASITASGTSIVIHMDSGPDFGPFPLPILEPHWRGEWVAFTVYEELDLFTVANVGLFLVLVDHTAAATFDPEATDVDDNPLYKMLIAIEGGNIELASPATGDTLRYDEDDAKFHNVRQKYIISGYLNGLMSANQNILFHKVSTDITIPADFGDFLEYSSGAGSVTATTADSNIGVSVAPPSALTTFTLIGTIHFSASGSVATLTTVGHLPIDIEKGSLVRVRSPSGADTTLAGFYFTLVARET